VGEGVMVAVCVWGGDGACADIVAHAGCWWMAI
jgi:hypothetical protein